MLAVDPLGFVTLASMHAHSRKTTVGEGKMGELKDKIGGKIQDWGCMYCFCLCC